MKQTFIMLCILVVAVACTRSGIEGCEYDNLKVMDMEIKSKGSFAECDDCLWITFLDCLEGEEFQVCWEGNHTWFFEDEHTLPEHFQVGDYVRMEKCVSDGSHYSRRIDRF